VAVVADPTKVMLVDVAVVVVAVVILQSTLL
jgi:hypothetical protein